MEDFQDKYIHFPLCLQQLTISQPLSGFRLIKCFGIVHFASKLNFDIIDVGRQLMYCYYRKPHLIQLSLLKKMESLIERNILELDEDYYGFNVTGTQFDPFTEDNGKTLLGILHSDREFCDDAILRYRIEQAELILGYNEINITDTIQYYQEGLEHLTRFENMHGPDCWTSIKYSMIGDFMDSGENIDLLQSYIGIKSILGRKEYVSTNKLMIASRMIGCKSMASLTEFINSNVDAALMYKKYSGRKRMDNLIFNLTKKGFIMYLSKKHVREILISTIYRTPIEMAEAVQKNRAEKDLKRKIKDARALF